MGECSYVFIANDGKNVSVFTWFMYFYDYPSDQRTSEAALESAVLYIVFCLAMIINITILLVTACDQTLRRFTTHYYIAAMCMVYIVFNVISPLVASSRNSRSWNRGRTWCKLSMYLVAIAGTTALWVLSFISIDRYNHVANFVKRRSRNDPKKKIYRTIGAILAVAAIGSVLLLPLYTLFDVYEVSLNKCHGTDLTILLTNDSATKVCTIFWTRSSYLYGWFTLLLLLIYILPLCLICYKYHKIYMIVRTVRANRMRREVSHLTGRRFEKVEMKVIKNSISLVVLYVLMWTPIFVTSSIIVIVDCVITSKTFFWVFVMTVSNGVISPLFYAVMNQRFNFAFKRQITRITSKFQCCTPNKRVSPGSAWPMHINVIQSTPPATPEVFRNPSSKTLPDNNTECNSSQDS